MSVEIKDTPEFRRLAQVAASQALNGAAELLQSSLDGPTHYQTAWDDEPIELLADATKLAIQASIEAGEPSDGMRDQLLAALVRYLEGWA